MDSCVCLFFLSFFFILLFYFPLSFAYIIKRKFCQTCRIELFSLPCPVIIILLIFLGNIRLSFF